MYLGQKLGPVRLLICLALRLILQMGDQRAGEDLNLAMDLSLSRFSNHYYYLLS